MKVESLQERLAAKGVAYAGWLHVPSTLTADIMARSGLDALVVDMQHGPVSDAAMLELLPTVARSGMLAMARVGGNDPAAIMRLLDAGAMGIICPLVNDAEQARRFVNACLYPPLGGRSWGPSRASVAYGGYHATRANEAIAPFAMIETREGLDALDAIAATPHLTGLFVGPADLSFALKGDPVVDFTWPPLLEALRRVVDACHRHDLVPGIYTTRARDALKMRELGFRFIVAATDATMLANKVREEVAVLTAADLDM